MKDPQEAVDRAERQHHRDTSERKNRQPLERLWPALLAIALDIQVDRLLRPQLDRPLQLGLRALEGQDARAGTHRWLAFRLGQAFFGVLSH